MFWDYCLQNTANPSSTPILNTIAWDSSLNKNKKSERFDPVNDLITTDLDQTLVNIKNYLGHPADLVTQILSGKNATLIIYLEALVNEDQLFGKIQEFINLPSLTGINPLPQDTRDPKSVLEDLAQGHAIFLEIRNDHVFVYNLPVPGWQMRPIEEPISEQLIRGPREGFTETISVNTAMIRRWINDPNLRVGVAGWRPDQNQSPALLPRRCRQSCPGSGSGKKNQRH